MGNKIVGHCRKVSTALGLRNVIAHNCRESLYDAAGKVLPEATLPEYISHPERAPLNEGDRCGASAVLKRRTERLAAVDLPRKVQQNASAAIEGTFSASPGWFTAHPEPEEWSRYFRDIRTLLFELYGEENALHWAVHYDELTPHMHVVFVPLTRNQQIKPTKKERAADPECKTRYIKGDELRYSSSNFLGGNVGLEILHDELFERVGKSRGLERGIRGSRARHTDQYSWAAKNARDREELDRKAAQLAAKEAELAAREQELEQSKARLAHSQRLNERAAAIIQGKDPAIMAKARSSLLFSGLTQEGMDELFKKVLPIADELRSRQTAKNASPTARDGARPSKTARDKERDDYER